MLQKIKSSNPVYEYRNPSSNFFNMHTRFHCPALLAGTAEATETSMLLEKQSNEFLARSFLLLHWFFWLLFLFVCFFWKLYEKEKKNQHWVFSFHFLKQLLQWVVSRLGHYFPGVHPELMHLNWCRAQWDLAGAELLAISFASFIYQIRKLYMCRNACKNEAEVLFILLCDMTPPLYFKSRFILLYPPPYPGKYGTLYLTPWLQLKIAA